MIGDAACDAIASETGGRSAVATFAARKRQLPQTSEGGEDRILHCNDKATQNASLSSLSS